MNAATIAAHIVASLFGTAPQPAAAEATVELAAATETATEETMDLSQLRAADPLSHDSATAAIMIEGVRRVLDEELSTLDRRRLGDKVLSERRVQIYEGAFGDGAALVTVNVELRVKDPSEPRSITGVFTLTADGDLATILVPPQMRAEQYAVPHLGDVDADGHDDVHLWTSSPDTTSDTLIRWDGGTARAPRAFEPTYEEGC